MRLRGSRDETVFAGPGADAAYAGAREALWRYRFYPPSIVSGELAAPAVGVVIHQAIRAGPLRFRGPVRVTRVWAEADRCGYRYEALPGHAERGWAEFELTRVGDAVRFRITSDAAFAHWLARLGGPVARWHRARAIDGAFTRMREAAHGRNLPPTA